MKILIRIVLIIVVIGALGLAMHTLIEKKKRDLQAFASQPRPISTVAAEPAIVETRQNFLVTIGTVTAVQDVDVSSEVAGQVNSIRFESGQHVEAGDTLATLETSIDVAELNGLTADQRLSEIQFDRSERLRSDKTISEAEYDIAAAKRDSARATVRAQQARLQKKIIRAPFSGMLGLRQVDLGQYIEPGTEVVSLQMLDPIHVDFALPERFLDHVTLNQMVEITVQAYRDEIFLGQVSAIEPGIDRATRNVRIRANFGNPDHRLRPGMFAEVRITSPQKDEVITVPETAIIYTPYGNSVFVVEETTDTLKVTRRQVETGTVRNGRVSIVSGLEIGMRVVSAGHNKLRNGMTVRVDDGDSLSAITTPQ